MRFAHLTQSPETHDVPVVALVVYAKRFATLAEAAEWARLIHWQSHSPGTAI
jgi:hypothetical protein